jgi:hypothetical protein
MRRCPSCRKVGDTFQYEAWVVRAKGVVKFGEGGLVSQVGPAASTTVVKPGRELDSPSARLTCSACKHTGNIKTFEVVSRSYISGEESSVGYSLGSFTLHLTARERDIADVFFSAENMSPDTPSNVVTALFEEMRDFAAQSGV